MSTSWLKLTSRTAVLISLTMLGNWNALPPAQAASSSSTQGEYERMRRKEILRREMNDIRRDIKDCQAKQAELAKSKDNAQKKITDAKEKLDRMRQEAESAKDTLQQTKQQLEAAAREMADTRKRMLEGLMFTEPSMSLKREWDVAKRHSETAREDAIHLLNDDASYAAKSTLKQEASEELKLLRASGVPDQDRMTQLMTQVMNLEQELARTETQYLQNHEPYLAAKAKLEQAEKAWKNQESENLKALDGNEDYQALVKTYHETEAVNKAARDAHATAMKNSAEAEAEHRKTKAAMASLEAGENELERREKKLQDRLDRVEREYQNL